VSHLNSSRSPHWATHQTAHKPYSYKAWRKSFERERNRNVDPIETEDWPKKRKHRYFPVDGEDIASYKENVSLNYFKHAS
jgi:hypothetical protein